MQSNARKHQSQCRTKAFTRLAMAALLAAPLVGFSADLPVVNLTVHQGRFSPETVPVPANTRFRLVVKNEGPGAEEFESSDLNQERVVPAGQSKDFFLGPLKAGEYKFFGDFHRDTANGKLVAR